MVSLSYENVYRARIEAILLTLSETKVVTNNYLANQFAMQSSTCTRTMNSLIRCGLVSRINRGEYTIGFDPLLKMDIEFSIPGLVSSPDIVKAVYTSGSIQWFWVSRDDDIPEIQEFGAFSNVAGLIFVRKSGREVLNQWKRENKGIWNKIKLFCTGRT